jgi:hypothetical protein
MPKRRHKNKRTGRNYNNQYIEGNSRPSTPLRDMVYEIYPVGVEASTMEIMRALYKRFNYVPLRSNLAECLMRAVKDGEVSRRKISHAGRNGQSTEVLWTFLDNRPVYVDQAPAPPMGAVQLDREKAAQYLQSVKERLDRLAKMG